MNKIDKYPLDKLIKKKALTKREIASEMGITEMRLYQLISQPDKMRIEQLKWIADILKMEPDKLFKAIII